MVVLRQACVLVLMLLALAGDASADESLRYAGATTLQRFFIPEVARAFTDVTAIKVHIAGGNTGAGISALLNGEVDMAGAGRFLTEAEKKRGLVELFLGWDVLSIIVNEQNPVDNLALDQLQGIFSGQILDWQDVGGRPGPIVVVTCPDGSGMRSAVRQLILKDKDYLDREVVSAIVAEADYQVALFPSGVTALSQSMVDVDGVKAIKVDGAEANAANVVSGRYPLAKPLTLVTRGEPEGDLARFFAVVKSPQGKAVLQKNFVPAQ